MDPISVTASLLTVLGAACTAGQALEHLSHLRHAPDQLIALTNEVSDLRVVLSTAREAVQERVETSQDCGNLAQILERASRKITELNHLICYDLVKNGADHTPSSKPKASHTAFLRHHGKIRSLKVDLREIKLSLLIAVGALTFADISRLKLLVCNVDFVAPRKLEHMQSIPDHRTTNAGREPSACSTLQTPTTKTHEARCVLKIANAVPNLAGSDINSCWTDHPMEKPFPRTTKSLESGRVNELVSMRTERQHHNSHIIVETSVLPPNHCDRLCLCQCHQVTNLATPNNLGKVMGRLFIGYIGLPVLGRRQCNRITCQQGRTQIRIRIAYLFPIWFALRLIAMTITMASTSFMLTLSTPMVTSPAAPMFVLASLGNVEKIQALLATNAAVLNAIEAVANKCLLQNALQFYQIDLVFFLVQQGADIFSQDCNSKTPLDTYYENYFTADEDKRMTALLPLFEKHNVFDHWNSKHIHLIILGCSSVDLSTYLAISNDGIDVVDSWGRTALMWAAWRGESSSVAVLLDFGANPRASSFDGNSVLIYATYGGSPECLRLILSTGANINHTSHSLLTPAIGGSQLGDNPAIAKVRLERGAAIEASRKQKFTPLYVAALTNRVEILMYLLDSGATTDVEAWDCSTPLSMALSFNNHRMAEELIRRGAKLNSASAFTTSYLRSAAVFGDERMMRLIMDARPAIDVTLKDSQGCTAQDRMKERLHSMGPSDTRRERLAAAFQQLVNVCQEEYDGGDQEEIFHDALEY